MTVLIDIQRWAMVFAEYIAQVSNEIYTYNIHKIHNQQQMRVCLSAKYAFSSLLKNFGIVNAKIIHNCTYVPQFYEYGINVVPDSPFTNKNHISSTGAFSSHSGLISQRQHGIRSIVNNQDIDWNERNKPISQHTFTLLEDLAKNYFNTRRGLYVIDGYAGWHPQERLRIRVVCTRAYHALFMTNMLVKPTPKQHKEDFASGADYYIFNAGQFHSNKNIAEINNSSAVAIDLQQRKMVILGTQYAGQMKSGLFTIMNYLMPKRKYLSLMGACNKGRSGDVSLFLGMPGSGKTTMAMDATRTLVADDQLVWTNTGIFNIQGGCHMKVSELTKEKSPLVHRAIRFGTVLQNAVMDHEKRQVNYFDTTISENIRAAYPLDYLSNAQIPALTTTHPKNIFLLANDASSVFPLVSKLTPEQALYHFYSGYSSRMITKGGIKDHIPFFSACYEEDFIPSKPSVYANIFYDKIKDAKINVWLINTGWIGGGAHINRRIGQDVIKKVISAIQNDTIDNKKEWGTMPIFNLSYIKQIQGVEERLLCQEKAWMNKEDYVEALKNTANKFRENFKRFENDANKNVWKGAPQA